MLNAAARHRPQGPPRHTTASCAEEWLAHLPPAKGASVLVVSGNPHTERTLGDIARVARTAGRDDLSLHPAGNGAPEPPWRLELCLGEVARLLYNDAVPAVLEDRARLLGCDHPHTLYTRHALAWVLGQRGDLTAAEAEYRAALEGQTRLLGEDHPHTRSTSRALDDLLLRIESTPATGAGDDDYWWGFSEGGS
ncbi:tetratricopeptide repeat protein [Streptomyces sp. SCA3-4]|uniref:tetratricopeptide repeat protein n=1 Tax=Streptomyces sichuanensis TaxID=2871810 RepID=UPI001CE3733A|nr:tetratricopeptide repeat protein [Streptomyces sichuanensis]MCA6095546.1 tetratricopeptide repeat protein [Streptomyces sichuanensis]